MEEGKLGYLLSSEMHFAYPVLSEHRTTALAVSRPNRWAGVWDERAKGGRMRKNETSKKVSKAGPAGGFRG